MIGSREDWFESERLTQIALERFHFHATQTVSLYAVAPMMQREVEMVRYIDQMAQTFACQLYSYVAKGETTHESKLVEHAYDFKVFASWWDHLKYDLRERRVLAWTPHWLWRRMEVKHITITKKHADSVPVSIVRVCPHATFSWDKQMYKHIHFLAPSIPGVDKEVTR